MRRNGFTLIEMVVVITITSVLAGFIGSALRYTTLNYQTGSAINRLATKANIALNNLTREIKSAHELTAISGNSISFVNQSGQSISYQLQSQSLMRQEDGGSFYPMTNEVNTLTFTYYDNTGSTTATASSVVFFTCQLGLSDDVHSYSLITATEIRAQL